jgi:hypothetical protein
VVEDGAVNAAKISAEFQGVPAASFPTLRLAARSGATLSELRLRRLFRLNSSIGGITLVECKSR